MLLLVESQLYCNSGRWLRFNMPSLSVLENVVMEMGGVHHMDYTLVSLLISEDIILKDYFYQWNQM